MCSALKKNGTGNYSGEICPVEEENDMGNENELMQTEHDSALGQAFLAEDLEDAEKLLAEGANLNAADVMVGITQQIKC